MMILIVAPMFLTFSLPVPIQPRTQDFKNTLDSIPKGSGVLIGLQIESISTATEIKDFWIALFTYLIRDRNFQLVITAQGPAGATAAETILKIIDPDTKYNYKYGINYAIMPYQPGDEIAMAATASSFAATYATDNRGNPLNTLPIMQRFHGLADMSLCIVFYHIITYAEMYIRQWPVKYGVPCLVIGSFNVVAPYYPRYVKGQIELTSQAYSEFELLVDIPGIELKKLNATNLQALFQVAMIFIGLGVSVVEAMKPKKVITR
jgi:hypothetical protein